MAQDRYNRVFLLPEHLHAKGLPFEIQAGALLIDGKTGDALVQLKMASQADAHVKAVKVSIQPSDVRGEALGDPVTHQYLDLDVLRDESFGQKEPITLPDNSTRSFSILSAEVVYDDNSTASSDAEWVPLPEQEALKATISDEELLKQYQLDYGEGCQYQLQELDDLWRCVCGATNRDDEDACHSCGQQHDALKAIDRETLEEHKNARLEAERLEHEAQLEKERLEKEEAERTAAEKKKKNKKAALIGAAIAAVAIAAYLIVNMVIIPSGKYKDALALMQEGSYTEAEEAFMALGNFKDSPTKVSECQYNEAAQLMETGNYLDARTAFEALGDFQDSAAKAEECNTNLEQMAEDARAKIAEFIAQGNYEAALVSATHAGLEDPDAVLLQGEKDAIKAANVNDIVMYGKYGSGKPCLWQVLEKEDGSALLFSTVILTKSQYNADSHTSYYNDWENSDVRDVMQSILNTNNFTNGEIANVLNREHVYDSGKTCTDRVFFLTSEDVEKYFPDPESRITTNNGTPTMWWLSDVKSRHTEEGGYVRFKTVRWDNGTIDWWGEAGELGCRPAMWVSFE